MLTTNDKLLVLEQKRTLYLQSQFDSEIEYRIADRLKDDAAKKAQMERLKRIEQAIELINQEIAAIDPHLS